VSPLSLLKPAKALSPLPVAGIAHRSFSGPPETFSLPFSPLCSWICCLFPAIEFVVAPSSPLPNSGDPGANVARACLNSGDLTAVKRSGAARSHLFSLGLISLRPIQIKQPGRFAHARLTRPVPPVSAICSRSSFPV
jgi:hypothetical protein